MNPDNAPYSYWEDGLAKGIIPEIFAEIARRANIQYTIVQAKTRSEYNALLQSNQIDLIMDASFDYSQAEANGFKLTKPYLNLSVARLTPINFYGSVKKVAIPAGPAVTLLQDLPLFQSISFQQTASTSDAIQAVRDGSCDAAYLYMYTAQKYLADDAGTRLQIALLPKLQIEHAIATSRSNDYRLLSILSKSAESVRSNYAQQIVLKYTTGTPTKFSIYRYLYANPVPAVAASLVIVSLIFLAILAFLQMRTAKREHARKQELEHFLSYVCRANDLVLEVNPQNHTCRHYLLQDGRVAITSKNFQPEEFLQAFHPEDVTLMQSLFTPESLSAFSTTRQERYLECRQKEPDGTYQWYAYVIQGISKSKEHPQGGFILFRKNINKTKQALVDALSTARHASEAKGSFLSRMSHEIRTPLNAIIGYLTLMQRADTQEEQMKNYAAKSSLASKQLLAIINDVLDLSAIESGRLKIALSPFRLEPLLTELVSIFHLQAQEKQVQFSLQTSFQKPAELEGDALRLRQILTNLLANAIKFTPAGGKVSLSVTSLHPENGHHFFKFSVSDTGIGMSEKFLQRIFTPFEQESAQTAHKFGGSGLGLSITYNLIQMLHGSITVQSRLGQGSTFTVTLPFQACQEKAAGTNETATCAAPEIAKEQLTLLLAEDNPLNREIALALLSTEGIHLELANNGREAVEKFCQASPGTYQAILLDLQMPVMDGYTAAQTIRASQHQEAKTIPIIAVTADVFAENVARTFACGMNECITKPIDLNKLLQTLAKLIKHD